MREKQISLELKERNDKIIFEDALNLVYSQNNNIENSILELSDDLTNCNLQKNLVKI